MKSVYVGGLIAVVMLGLYTYAVVMGITNVLCAAAPACTPPPYTTGMVTALTAVGGLVSAVVVAELAATTPGAKVGVRALPAGTGPKVTTFVAVLSALYLAVWVITGLAAFVVGVMQHPKTLQPLTDIGQAWFGLAITTVYAYFGIKPNSNGGSGGHTQPKPAVTPPGP